MQELGIFSFKVNVTLNGLQKEVSFSNQLILIDSFQFLRSSLESLVRNLDKDKFK